MVKLTILKQCPKCGAYYLDKDLDSNEREIGNCSYIVKSCNSCKTMIKIRRSNNANLY